MGGRKAIHRLVEMGLKAKEMSNGVYRFSDADVDFVTTISQKIRLVYPNEAGACCLMSAMLMAKIHDETQIPARMVAGSLAVHRKFVFGDDRGFDGAAIFSADQPSWNGHCWIEVGEWIVDVSIFQTSVSPKCPPVSLLPNAGKK